MSDSPGNLVPQRPQSRAEDQKPPNQYAKTDDAASPEAQSDYSGVPEVFKTLFLRKKTTITANAPNSVPEPLRRAFPPVRCLMGRFPLALLVPFGTPEPPQSLKRSESQGNLVPQRAPKIAEDPKPPNQCPKTDGAASPEAQSDDSGEPQASKT